jgi:hypothetical protein
LNSEFITIGPVIFRNALPVILFSDDVSEDLNESSKFEKSNLSLLIQGTEIEIIIIKVHSELIAANFPILKTR